jgi:hypothetical protein
MAFGQTAVEATYSGKHAVAFEPGYIQVKYGSDRILLHPTKNLLATDDGSLRLWKLPECKQIACVRLPDRGKRWRFSSTGRYLIWFGGHRRWPPVLLELKSLDQDPPRISRLETPYRRTKEKDCNFYFSRSESWIVGVDGNDIFCWRPNSDKLVKIKAQIRDVEDQDYVPIIRTEAGRSTKYNKQFLELVSPKHRCLIARLEITNSGAVSNLYHAGSRILLCKSARWGKSDGSIEIFSVDFTKSNPIRSIKGSAGGYTHGCLSSNGKYALFVNRTHFRMISTERFSLSDDRLIELPGNWKNWKPSPSARFAVTTNTTPLQVVDLATRKRVGVLSKRSIQQPRLTSDGRVLHGDSVYGIQDSKLVKTTIDWETLNNNSRHVASLEYVTLDESGKPLWLVRIGSAWKAINHRNEVLGEVEIPTKPKGLRIKNVSMERTLPKRPTWLMQPKKLYEFHLILQDARKETYWGIWNTNYKELTLLKRATRILRASVFGFCGDGRFGYAIDTGETTVFEFSFDRGFEFSLRDSIRSDQRKFAQSVPFSAILSSHGELSVARIAVPVQTQSDLKPPDGFKWEAFEFSSTGKFLASIAANSGDDGPVAFISVVDTASRKSVFLSPTLRGSQLTFSADSKYLTVENRTGVEVFNLDDRTRVLKLNGRVLAFTPDSTSVLSQVDHELRLTELDSGKVISRIDVEEPCATAVFSTNSNRLLITTDRGAWKLIDVSPN